MILILSIIYFCFSQLIFHYIYYLSYSYFIIIIFYSSLFIIIIFHHIHPLSSSFFIILILLLSSSSSSFIIFIFYHLHPLLSSSFIILILYHPHSSSICSKICWTSAPRQESNPDPFPPDAFWRTRRPNNAPAHPARFWGSKDSSKIIPKTPEKNSRIGHKRGINCHFVLGENQIYFGLRIADFLIQKYFKISFFNLYNNLVLKYILFIIYN